MVYPRIVCPWACVINPWDIWGHGFTCSASVTMSSTILRAGSTALTPPTACPARLFTWALGSARADQFRTCETTVVGKVPMHQWSLHFWRLHKFESKRRTPPLEFVWSVYMSTHLDLCFVETQCASSYPKKPKRRTQFCKNWRQGAASKMAMRICWSSDPKALRSCCKGTILGAKDDRPVRPVRPLLERILWCCRGGAFLSLLYPKVWLSMAPWVNRPSIPLSQNSLTFMGSFSQLRIQSLGISRRGLPDSTKVRVVSRLSAAITLSWALVKDHWSDELGSSTALFSPVYNDCNA